MSTALSVLFIFIGVGIAVWLVSFIMEAMRPVPQAPRTLRWARDIPVEYPWRSAATRFATSGPARVPMSSFSTRCERN